MPVSAVAAAAMEQGCDRGPANRPTLRSPFQSPTWRRSSSTTSGRPRLMRALEVHQRRLDLDPLVRACSAWSATTGAAGGHSVGRLPLDMLHERVYVVVRSYDGGAWRLV